MKELRSSSLCILILFVLLAAQGCTPSGTAPATATMVSETLTPVEPLPTISSATATALSPTEVPATPTEIVPTIEPTPTLIANGQIAYISEGNVWRHILGSGMSVQVTTDGGIGDYPNTYTNPQFSPDGRYLAYTKGGASSISDLVAGTSLDISSYGMFYSWTEQGYEFFASLGDMECPTVEDLADQALLNFDLYRYDLADLGSPTLLANIGGGLKFVSAISNDGQWASISSCGCYSECGNEQLWQLSTASVITSPITYTGNIDFSPDSTALTMSTWQIYGYSESPLYVATIDMSFLTSVFLEAQTAPVLALWSPDGQWLAFSSLTFDADGMEITESRVMLVRADGSSLSTVQDGMAYLVDWSPDGSKLLYRQTTSSSESFFTYELSSGLKQPLPFIVDAYSSANIDWGNLQ